MATGQHEIDKANLNATAPVSASATRHHRLKKKQSHHCKTGGESYDAAKSQAQLACPRGGVAFALSQRDGGSVWRRQTTAWLNSSDNINAIVATLASAHWDPDVHNPSVWIDSVKSAMEGNGYVDKSLGSVVQRCRGISGKDICVNFLLMINYMQLVTKCQSKFAAIAGGGSVYILILVAGLRLRVSIGGMEGSLPWDLANLLQSPIPGSMEDFLTWLSSNHIALLYQTHKTFWMLKMTQTRPTIQLKEHKCERAEKGARVRNIKDLQSQLNVHYKEGMKVSDDTYICIPIDAIPNSLVDIRNSDETLMAFICTNLPAKICNSLTALHLSWYNRHCTKGRKAPSDVPPSMLDKIIPYISKDINNNQELFQSLKVVFEELFNWIYCIMQTHLPEECQMLEQVASILPGNHCSPAAPFLSIVININVQAKAHHDSKDQELCLVLPIGTFKGAALAMVETGLVIELNHGDFAIFRSSDITHLNLHYEAKSQWHLSGKRNSKGKSKAPGSKAKNDTVTLSTEEYQHILDAMNSGVQSTQAAQKEALEAKRQDFDDGGKDGPILDEQKIFHTFIQDVFNFYFYLNTYGCLFTIKNWQKTLIDASQGCRELQTKLLEVQSNEEMKTILIDYVWSAVAQVRGEIVAKARIIINGAYQIPGDMAPVQIKQAVMWLLETGAFADGDLDIKARTFNKQKPFCHQIFKDLIHNQWYGHKGEGLYLQLPQQLLNVPSGDTQMVGVLFQKASVLQKKSPVWMKQMRDGLYQDILNLANLHYLGIDEDQMKDEDFGIDFEVLEDTIIAQAA
ncbi:hypothetical protein SERLADRAFT_404464 [Serpula lacrymans var. lacrymans S7.9]|uniref:DUF6532 domain-containing protein n=1 Tax=Serpula lacrymans var. lacrymans (strain S7.9) TaxID=578457 RepID=F8ND87_SERL9|nr:uncharacterized protein SERLADRAFT_404464 [Serpula lacrymans var. lacrymans S7.9]EGO30171.1 hypothetical protein SERLADRAFT_404464 [Serpula lacrymans var. lacrymans S7.9]